MATGQIRTSAHLCSCGKSFDSTEELVAHASEAHGFRPY